VTGGLDVDVDDGRHQARIRLDDPARGLSISPLVWIELTNFSVDAILLVLGSEPFDPATTIRDYDGFLEIVAPT
jgi:hypothetical protein